MSGIDPRFFGYSGFKLKATEDAVFSNNVSYQTEFVHRYEGVTDFMFHAAAIVTTPIIWAIMEVAAIVLILKSICITVYNLFAEPSNTIESAKEIVTGISMLCLSPFLMAITPVIEFLHVLASLFAPVVKEEDEVRNSMVVSN